MRKQIVRALLSIVGILFVTEFLLTAANLLASPEMAQDKNSGKLIDLSLGIDPNDPDNPFARYARVRAGKSVDVIKIGHYGTHLDIMGTASIDVNRFISVAKLVHVEKMFDRQIKPSDFENSVEINEGDFVIFKTGWFKKFYGNDAYFKDHPELSDKTIDFLIQKKVNFIGLDFMAAGRGGRHYKIDMRCAKQNIFIVENIANLELLTKDTFKVYCFPLNLINSSGLPVRIVAEEEIRMDGKAE